MLWWYSFPTAKECRQCTAYNEHRKLLIQEMNLTHFTGSEEEQFAIIMTPTKEEDFEALGQYILKCFRT